MIAQAAAPTVARRSDAARQADLFYAARRRGYTLVCGDEEQSGYWLSRANALNSMAQWYADLDAVERRLEAVK